MTENLKKKKLNRNIDPSASAHSVQREMWLSSEPTPVVLKSGSYIKMSCTCHFHQVACLCWVNITVPNPLVLGRNVSMQHTQLCPPPQHFSNVVQNHKVI